MRCKPTTGIVGASVEVAVFAVAENEGAAALGTNAGGYFAMTAFPPIIIHRVEEYIFFKKNFHIKKNVYFCIRNDSRIVGQKAEDF